MRIDIIGINDDVIIILIWYFIVGLGGAGLLAGEK